MRYVGKVYRPPSEADSLILQATIGCSWNRCSYCAMYLDKRFRPRPLDELKEDMDLAASYLGAENVRRVFLADGDALILRTARLLEILRELRARFPNFQRASVYASPQSLLSKSVAELAELKSAGLPLHYMGPETGHDEVLKRIAKGVTAAEMIEGARRVIDAGAKISLIFLLGIAGTELSHEHAVASGRLTSAIDPQYVSALTLVPVPGTPIHEEVESGRLVLPDPRGRLIELATMIEHMDVTRAIFRSNHASNALPLGGNLPADKGNLLAALRLVIADESIPLRAPPSPHRL
ncbi:MAG TPA: radical SAM protein [Planctomycetota bacterium]|nr:radical SAM protein [Planctomycetota bacterium]